MNLSTAPETETATEQQRPLAFYVSSLLGKKMRLPAVSGLRFFAHSKHSFLCSTPRPGLFWILTTWSESSIISNESSTTVVYPQQDSYGLVLEGSHNLDEYVAMYAHRWVGIAVRDRSNTRLGAADVVEPLERSAHLGACTRKC